MKGRLFSMFALRWTRVVAWTLLLVLGPALLVPVRAQSDQPVPTSVSLTGVRYDAARDIYELDLALAHHEAIGSLQVVLWNQLGVEVQRYAIAQPGASQTIQLEAAGLITGQTYRVEVMAFAPDGMPLISEQGSPISAEREFVHAPDLTGVHIGALLFTLDLEARALNIDMETVDAVKIAGYRVILKGEGTNVVTLDQRVEAAGTPPITISLDSVAEGQYLVVVQALDAAGSTLTTIEDVLTYQLPLPAMTQPLFHFDHDVPALLVDLEVESNERVREYRVSLIHPDKNEVAMMHNAQATDAPPITVPLALLSPGEYVVVVEALDAEGQTLASVAGETTYVPPRPPGLGEVVMNGLRANPVIPVTIAFIILAVVGWLVFRSLWERRISGTPLMQAGGLSASKTAGLPLNPPSVGRESQRQPATTQQRVLAAPPRLAVTVEAFPDQGRVGERIDVVRFPFTIGRGECDLDLTTDTGVSRRHAEIRFGQRGLYIVDKLSANGTYVNGERIAAESPVLLDITARTRVGIGRETHLVLEPARRR
ncbi:MAG: FHA domain-containing protein [Anaerolineae bacterium]